jgi:hypothetical protein
VDLEIEPEPTPEEERAIRAALADDDPPARRSRWAASALDDLRGDAPLQDPGREARIVES